MPHSCAISPALGFNFLYLTTLQALVALILHDSDYVWHLESQLSRIPPSTDWLFHMNPPHDHLYIPHQHLSSCFLLDCTGEQRGVVSWEAWGTQVIEVQKEGATSAQSTGRGVLCHMEGCSCGGGVGVPGLTLWSSSMLALGCGS